MTRLGEDGTNVGATFGRPPHATNGFYLCSHPTKYNKNETRRDGGSDGFLPYEIGLTQAKTATSITLFLKFFGATFL